MNTAKMTLLDKYVGGALLLMVKPLVFLTGIVLRRDHASAPRGDILVIKLLGAGSLFIAMPNLLALRRQYPHRKIYLLTTTGVAHFMRPLALFDAIFIIDTRNLFCLASSAVRALFNLWRIDTVVDLEIHSRAATLFAVFLMARNRLAFFVDEPFWKRHIATHLLFFSRTAAVYDYYDQLFNLLNVNPVSGQEVREYLLRDDRRIQQGNGGRHICIGHACSDNATERQLSPQAWVNVLSNAFAPQENVLFEILGGPGDFAFGAKIADALTIAFPGAKILNSCGIYLPKEVIAVLNNADEFWGIDSLLLHIARSLCKPTASFWGPSAPQTRLRNVVADRDKVFYDPIICSPCVHAALVAPCKGDNLCIQRITGVANLTKTPRWLVS